MANFFNVLLETSRDVFPIIFFLGFFQFVVIKKTPPYLSKIIIGIVFVIIGLTFFIIGLEKGLFPLGKQMAQALTAHDFLVRSAGADVHNLVWSDYYWVYVFAALIGFSTTIAEPSLIAVALKAQEISGGSISATGLRISVAIGVAAGIALGCFRIVTGTPLYMYIISGYMIVLIQSLFTPKTIIPLAFDSGGVTTSTVTVPLVAALGLGLSSSVDGRSPLLDGFGLIAFASLFPMFSVMAYAQLSQLTHNLRNQEK